MNNSLVSVIIPTYNRTDYVEEAILSAINQTYKNTEIIVCDDNAQKPEVRKSIVDICSRYPMVRLILNKENLGGSLNRNEGIKAAKGELISFLDDDDVYLPTRIEKVVDVYMQHKNEKIGIIYTNAYYTDDELNIKSLSRSVPTNNPLYKHMQNCLAPTSQWTVPKKAFEDVGLFEDTPCKQDSIMLLKILGAGYGALYIEEPLSYFRMRLSGRISSNHSAHIIGESNYANFLRRYYHLLTTEQVRTVESGIHRRFLQTYSSIGKKGKALHEAKLICKNTGITSLTYRDIMYLFFSPQFYTKFKNLLRK